MPMVVPQASKLDARVRSGDAAWAHVEAEYAGIVDGIMATLVPEEPYAFANLPATVEPVPAGVIPHQPFVTSRAGVRAAYESLRSFAATRSMQPVAEIKGDWYVFLYGWAEGLIKATNQPVFAQSAVLLPTMGKDGITGELLWNRLSVGPAYTGGREGPLAAETAILDRHEALLDALRQADATAVAALFHRDAQIGIRDYVNDTGTLAEMHSALELKHYLERFFNRFDVHEIGLVHRLATDWFVFAELLWIVEDKEAGQTRSFFTAAHSEVLPDGLFAAYIGHGTDCREV